MTVDDVATSEVTLSSKHQIVVPRGARRALGLRPGDKLLVVTLAGQVILLRKPASYAETTGGLMRGAYPKGYLRRERRAWE